MGKQINYYLDMEGFRKIAQAALEEGCLIVSREFEPEPPKPSGDLTAIREELYCYYFYLPDLGELRYTQSRAGSWHVDPLGAGASRLIEGAFSRKHENGPDGRVISRQRLYVHTGYYDEEGLWTPRPERLTKVYDKLARLVRKQAPATLVEYDDVEYGEDGAPLPIRRQCKPYISPTCLEWRAQGYEMSGAAAMARRRYERYLKEQKRQKKLR